MASPASRRADLPVPYGCTRIVVVRSLGKPVRHALRERSGQPGGRMLLPARPDDDPQRLVNDRLFIDLAGEDPRDRMGRIVEPPGLTQGTVCALPPEEVLFLAPLQPRLAHARYLHGRLEHRRIFEPGTLNDDLTGSSV